MRLLSSTMQLLSALSILYSTASAQNNQIACNNSPSLCDRSYSNITHLGAHNSPFVRDASTSFSTSGNHFYNTTVQLDSGVRMLTGQVHRGGSSNSLIRDPNSNTNNNNTLNMCHASCALLNAGRMRDWLTEIRVWMDRNPNEVVTILLVNADSAEPADLQPEFQAAGIEQYAFEPQGRGRTFAGWPTLRTMINTRRRLVVFVATIEESPTVPYLLNEFDWVYENDFRNTNPTMFSCTPDRPDQVARMTPNQAIDSGRLFLMNNFLYQSMAFDIEVPDVDRANITNSNTAGPNDGALGDRIRACTREANGRSPNFVLVDFFNLGPAIDPVDRSNRLAGPPVGRRGVSNQPLNETAQANGAERANGSTTALLSLTVAIAALVFTSL